MHKSIGVKFRDYYTLYPNRKQSRAFCFEIFINTARRLLSRSHRENYGRGTDYGIAARKHAFARCLPALFVRNQAAPAMVSRPSVVEASSGFGEVPSAMMTVSAGISSSEPGISTGLLLPDASGSPSSI